jgi:C_GCAxxG_C_C family probable redox protein
MTLKEKSLSLFREDYNCAQAVFSAYSKIFEIKEKEAKRIASGFGWGIANYQKTCGALAGAAMLIGCKYFDDDNPIESKDVVYKKVKKLFEDFRKKHGSQDCIELIGIHLQTKAGQNKAKKENVYELKCTKYISDICDLLEKHI